MKKVLLFICLGFGVCTNICAQNLDYLPGGFEGSNLDGWFYAPLIDYVPSGHVQTWQNLVGTSILNSNFVASGPNTNDLYYWDSHPNKIRFHKGNRYSFLDFPTNYLENKVLDFYVASHLFDVAPAADQTVNPIFHLLGLTNSDNTEGLLFVLDCHRNLTITSIDGSGDNVNVQSNNEIYPSTSDNVIVGMFLHLRIYLTNGVLSTFELDINGEPIVFDVSTFNGEDFSFIEQLVVGHHPLFEECDAGPYSAEHVEVREVVILSDQSTLTNDLVRASIAARSGFNSRYNPAPGTFDYTGIPNIYDFSGIGNMDGDEVLCNESGFLKACLSSYETLAEDERMFFSHSYKFSPVNPIALPVFGFEGVEWEIMQTTKYNDATEIPLSYYFDNSNSTTHDFNIEIDHDHPMISNMNFPFGRDYFLLVSSSSDFSTGVVSYPVLFQSGTTTLTDITIPDESFLTIGSPVIDDADFSFITCANTVVFKIEALEEYVNSIFNVNWEFGQGGATSTDRNPIHEYLAPGTYNVTLEYDLFGEHIVVSKNITVSGLSIPPVELQTPLHAQRELINLTSHTELSETEQLEITYYSDDCDFLLGFDSKAAMYEGPNLQSVYNPFRGVIKDDGSGGMPDELLAGDDYWTYEFTGNGEQLVHFEYDISNFEEEETSGRGIYVLFVENILKGRTDVYLLDWKDGSFEMGILEVKNKAGVLLAPGIQHVALGKFPEGHCEGLPLVSYADHDILRKVYTGFPATKLSTIGHLETFVSTTPHTPTIQVLNDFNEFYNGEKLFTTVDCPFGSTYGDGCDSRYGAVTKGKIYFPSGGTYGFQLHSDELGEFRINGLPGGPLSVTDDVTSGLGPGLFASTVLSDAGIYDFELYHIEHTENGGNDFAIPYWHLIGEPGGFDPIPNDNLTTSYSPSVGLVSSFKNVDQYTSQSGFKKVIIPPYFNGQQQPVGPDMGVKITRNGPAQGFGYLQFMHNGLDFSTFNEIKDVNDIVVDKPYRKLDRVWCVQAVSSGQTFDFEFLSDAFPTYQNDPKYLLLIAPSDDPTFSGGNVRVIGVSEDFVAEGVSITENCYVTLGVIVGGCGDEDENDKAVIGFAADVAPYNSSASGVLTMSHFTEESNYIGLEKYLLMDSYVGATNAFDTDLLPVNGGSADKTWCLQPSGTSVEAPFDVEFSVSQADWDLQSNAKDHYRPALVFSTDEFNSNTYVVGLELDESGIYHSGPVQVSDVMQVRLGYINNYLREPGTAVFENEVGGIGDALNYSQTSDEQGDLRIQAMDPMAVDEHLLWGHSDNQNGSIDLTITNDVPQEIKTAYPAAARSNRVWRIEEDGETGALHVSFDVSIAGEPNLVLLKSGVNDFTNAEVIGLHLVDGYYHAFDVNLNDGDFLALASASYSANVIETGCELGGAAALSALTNDCDITVGGGEFPISSPYGPCTKYVDDAEVEVTFGFDGGYHFGEAPFTCDLEVHVIGTDASNNELFKFESLQLRLSEKEPLAKTIFNVSQYYNELVNVKVDVIAFDINQTVVNPELEFALLLSTDINETSRVRVPKGLTGVIATQTDELSDELHEMDFSWDGNTCPATSYEFQLLKLYNDDPSTTGEFDLHTIPNWDEALTIEVPTNAVSLAMAEGEGYYMWRVRPIGDYYEGGISNSMNWGEWTDTPSEVDYTALPNLNYAYFWTDPEDDINYIYGRTFTENGRLSESVSYANGLQFVAQTQTHLRSNLSPSPAALSSEILAAQTVYDYSGRVGVQSLVAPIDGQQELGYANNFMTKGSTLYGPEHFDDDNNFHNDVNAEDDELEIGATEIGVDGGILNNYYSDLNPDLRIPSAEGFPFTRNLYAQDGSGRVEEAGGVGPVLSIGQGHSVRTKYGTATDDELIRIFGKEAPIGNSVIKVLTTDQNNVVSISYISKEGHTIATALAVTSEDSEEITNLEEIASIVDAPFGITQNFNGNEPIYSDGEWKVFRAETIVLEESSDLQYIKVDFEMTPEIVTSICGDYCATCEYDIEISLKEESTGELIPDLVLNHTIVGSDLTGEGCSVSLYTPETSLTNGQLSKGSYFLRKSIRLSKAHQDAFVEAASLQAEEDIWTLLDPLTSILKEVEACGKVLDDNCTVDLDDFITALKSFYLAQDETYSVVATKLNALGSPYVINITPSTELDGDMVFTVTTACCEIDLPIALPVKNICESEVAPFDNVNFEIEYLKMAYGANYDGQTIIDLKNSGAVKVEVAFDYNLSGLSQTYSYGVNDFDDLIHNMLDEQVTGGGDMYTCQQIWDCVQGIGAVTNGMLFVSQNDGINIVDVVNDGINANQDVTIPDGVNYTIEMNIIETLLNCVGRHYKGFVDPSDIAKLKLKPYLYFAYSKDWANPTSGDYHPEIRHAENGMCSNAGIPDLDDVDIYDWQIPDLTLGGNGLDFCNADNVCQLDKTLEAGGYSTITNTTLNYPWGEADYSAYEQALQSMRHGVANTSTLGEQQNTILEDCHSACEDNYEAFLDELRDLYYVGDDNDGFPLYADENNSALAFEDLCCTAQALVEECQSGCHFTIQEVECDGVMVPVAYGKQEELDYFQQVIHASFDLTKPAPLNGGNPTTFHYPSRTAYAFVDLVQQILDEYRVSKLMNETPLDEALELKDFGAYYYYPELFQAEGYTQVRIKGTPLGRLEVSVDGTTWKTVGLGLDDAMTTSGWDWIELAGIGISSLTDANNLQIQIASFDPDESITTEAVGTEINTGVFTDWTDLIEEAIVNSQDVPDFGQDASGEEDFRNFDLMDKENTLAPPRCVVGGVDHISQVSFLESWFVTHNGVYGTSVIDDVKEIDDGYIILVREIGINNNNGGKTVKVVRIDKQGAIVWEQFLFQGPSGIVDNLVHVLHGGITPHYEEGELNSFRVAVHIGAQQSGSLVPVTVSSSAVWVFEMGLDGTFNPDTDYNFIYENNEIVYVEEVLENASGELHIAGSKSSSYIVLKLDAAGSYEWGKTYSGIGGASILRAGAEFDKEGNLIVMGRSNSEIGNEKSNGVCNESYQDIWVISILPDGEVDWDKVIGVGKYSLQPTHTFHNEGFVLLGDGVYCGVMIRDDIDKCDRSETLGGYDFWLVKLDVNSGDLQWEKSFGGSGSDNLRAIVALVNDNIGLIGFASNQDGDFEGVNNGTVVVEVSPEGIILDMENFSSSLSALAFDFLREEDGSVISYTEAVSTSSSAPFSISRSERNFSCNPLTVGLRWNKIIHNPNTQSNSVLSMTETQFEGLLASKVLDRVDMSVANCVANKRAELNDAYVNSCMPRANTETKTEAFESEGLSDSYPHDGSMYSKILAAANGNSAYAATTYIDVRPGDVVSGTFEVYFEHNIPTDHVVFAYAFVDEEGDLVSNYWFPVKINGLTKDTWHTLSFEYIAPEDLPAGAQVKTHCYNPKSDPVWYDNLSVKVKHKGGVRERTSYAKGMKAHHYTLYYYDRAGNLVSTVPPAGVEVIDVINATTDGNSNIVLSSLPETQHRMITEYHYNSLGQLISQETPDGGETEFIYNDEGLLRFSQNAQQFKDNKFSYTKYDALARIIEVGESNLPMLGPNMVSFDGLDASMFLGGGLAGGGSENITAPYGEMSFPLNENFYSEFDNIDASISQLTRTVYSTPGTKQFTYREGQNWKTKDQRYLRNRVSYSYTDEDGNLTTDADQVVTYYSYDPHGNVEWLIQSLPGLGENYISYEYDLISGNVLQVNYNEGLVDQFYHRYTYDADNRITAVETSGDGTIWEQDAHYEYYAHGPLKRTELGEDDIQGLDYVYTLQGWLKGVNHFDVNIRRMPEGKPRPDLTQDGTSGQNFAQDIFGMEMAYFDGDFSHKKSPFDKTYDHDVWNDDAHHANYGAKPLSLYNGNISGIADQVYDTQLDFNLHDNIETNDDIKYYQTGGFNQYKYDQLNRLRSSSYAARNNLQNESDYNFKTNGRRFGTEYGYDGNGNIDFLKRWNVYNNAFDNLSYVYDPSGENNKLLSLSEPDTYAHLLGSDIDGHEFGTTNYLYDDIGNLIGDENEDITIEWTVYGKVKNVIKDDGSKIQFNYDASGNRISKRDVSATPGTPPDQVTYYVRDASGNPMSIYTSTDGVTRVADQPIYGSDRLGSRRSQVAIDVINPQISATDLLITEAMYDSPVIGAESENFGRYVMIQNVSNSIVDLGRFWLNVKNLSPTGGWQYNQLESQLMYPGQRLLITGDQGATGFAEPTCVTGTENEKVLEVLGLDKALANDPDLLWQRIDNFDIGGVAAAIKLEWHKYNSDSRQTVDYLRYGTNYAPFAPNTDNATPCTTTALNVIKRTSFIPGNALFAANQWSVSLATATYEMESVAPTLSATRRLDMKDYEIKDHLGNVRAVIGDRKLIYQRERSYHEFGFEDGVEASTVNPFHGEYSWHGNDPGDLSSPQLIFEVEPGDVLNMGAWLFRDQLTSNKTGVFFKVTKNGQNILSNRQDLTKTNEWELLQYVYTVPTLLPGDDPETTVFEVKVFGTYDIVDANAGNDFYVDNMYVEVIHGDYDNNDKTFHGESVFLPDLRSYSNYYPFGWEQPNRSYSGDGYRYGFNGMEKDDELKGNGASYDFGARMYDPRVAKFLSLDPKMHQYPYWSPYLYAANGPIVFIDEDGEGPVITITSKTASEAINRIMKTTDSDDVKQRLVENVISEMQKNSFGEKVTDGSGMRWEPAEADHVLGEYEDLCPTFVKMLENREKVSIEEVPEMDGKMIQTIAPDGDIAIYYFHKGSELRNNPLDGKGDGGSDRAPGVGKPGDDSDKNPQGIPPADGRAQGSNKPGKRLMPIHLTVRKHTDNSTREWGHGFQWYFVDSVWTLNGKDYKPPVNWKGKDTQAVDDPQANRAIYESVEPVTKKTVGAVVVE